MTASTQHSAPYGPDIAPVAALMADPTRATILNALFAGRPLAAGELARMAGVSPATVSVHLARLLDGGMVTVTVQGRHRYYSLAGREAASVIEALSRISPASPVRNLRQSREAAALDEARTCYDHLAGRAGVALLDALLAGGVLAERPGPGPGPSRARPDGRPAPGYEVTGEGTRVLASFGLDIAPLKRSRRHFAGACLDWTQRRRHLSGALGAAITARLFDLGWIERGHRRRSIRVTEAGLGGLAETFGAVLAPAAGAGPGR